MRLCDWREEGRNEVVRLEGRGGNEVVRLERRGAE